MKRLIILTLFLIIFIVQDSDQIRIKAQEKVHNFTTEELETMDIKDTSKKLTEDEQKDLVKLITEKYVQTIRLKLDEYVDMQTKIGILLLNNFPDLKKRMEEPGIRLSEMVRYFNANPKLRQVINEVLVKQKLRKCS